MQGKNSGKTAADVVAEFADIWECVEKGKHNTDQGHEMRARVMKRTGRRAPPGPAEAPPAPEAKRQKSGKTAADLVAEFAEIRECVEKGILTTEQAQEMCTRLMKRE